MPPNLDRDSYFAQDAAVLRRAQAGELVTNEWGFSYYWCLPDGTRARRMPYREQDHVTILQGARLLTEGERRTVYFDSGEWFVGIALTLTEKAAQLLHDNKSSQSSTKE